MENRENLLSALQELRKDSAQKSKKGISFILASVFVWILILCIHLSALPILTKNMLTFCCSIPLVLLACLISRLIGADFQNRENPLTQLGILFAVNQILYILIAMWIYAAVPDKMLMIYAMIFGAHLLPYGWLYQSRTYCVFSVLVSGLVLYVGCNYPTVVVAILMLIIEMLFSVCLWVENRMDYSTL